MPKRKTERVGPRLDDVSPEGLTYREELFCHLYVETANASEAYRRAGGASKRADATSSQMMSRPHIARRIDELKTRRLASIQFNAREVLERLIAQVRADLSDIFNDLGGLKAVSEWPAVWRTGLIAGIEVMEQFEEKDDEKVLIGYLKKVKVADRVKILDLAGRHVDINAWRDRGGPELSEVMQLMLASFARDTWVEPPRAAAPAAASEPGKAVAGVLD